MKIGIVTFHRAHNYGAQLQAYALNTVLTRMGHDVSFIDYHQANVDKSYRLIDWSKYRNAGLLNAVKTLVVSVVTFRRRKRRWSNFNKFSISFFKLSPQYNLKGRWAGGNYDAVIFGSDQIWTTRFLGEFDPILWGDINISTEKKISYAPSMEISSLTDQQKEFCRIHLENFDEISVREAQMKEMLSPLTKKDIKVVLDPVFLCDKEDYINLASKSSIKLPERYILLYSIGSPASNTVNICNCLSKKMALPIIRLCGLVERWKDSKRLDTAGPIDFLKAFVNAEFIVSTSFHGTAFSVLLGKDFYSIRNKGISGRAENLLNSIGLENRMISSSSEIKLDNLRIADYDRVHWELKSLATESIEFLKESLK